MVGFTRRHSHLMDWHNIIDSFNDFPELQAIGESSLHTIYCLIAFENTASGLLRWYRFVVCGYETFISRVNFELACDRRYIKR